MPSCLVLFCRLDFNLDTAATLLSSRGLALEAGAHHLLVRWNDGPQLRVSFAQGEEVRREAEEIAEGTDCEGQLGTLDKRFEIAFEDLEEVLDETNTLIEVQATLQEATDGFLFNSWNGSLVAPG